MKEVGIIELAEDLDRVLLRHDTFVELSAVEVVDRNLREEPRASKR